MAMLAVLSILVNCIVESISLIWNNRIALENETFFILHGNGLIYLFCEYSVGKLNISQNGTSDIKSQ